MSSVYRPFPEKLGGQNAATFVGNEGDLFYDPTTTTLRISDGSTPGGVGIGGGGSTTLDKIEEGNTSVETIDTGNNGTIKFETEGTDRWKITSAGHIIPYANAAYDIGNAEYKVRHLFLSDNTMYFQGDFLKVAQHNAGGAAQSPSYLIPLAKLKDALNASADYEAFKAAILAIGDAS
tara:strand:- start:30799 stop:31332 length:534 start_codon:yes stop_codon:yes gene_type:complete